MTRTRVLQAVMEGMTTPKRLSAVFGDDWVEPMESLEEIGLVSHYRRFGSTYFYLTRMGRGA